MTEKAAEDLVPLAKSWLHAAELKLEGSGYKSMGYDQAERAYQINCIDNKVPEPLSLKLLASEENPVVNPAFVITGWGDRDATLKIDGRSVERGKEFRFGHRRNPDSIDLIVWIKKETMDTIEITLSPNAK